MKNYVIEKTYRENQQWKRGGENPEHLELYHKTNKLKKKIEIEKNLWPNFKEGTSELGSFKLGSFLFKRS